MYDFPTSGPVTVAVKLTSGLIEITAGEYDCATVDVQPWDTGSGSQEAADRVRVELVGDRLLIESHSGGARWLLGRSGRVRVTVRVPVGSALDLGVTSADVRCHGRFGDVAVGSASGDVYVERVDGELDAKLTSGDLLVDEVTGRGKAHAASGDLTIGAVAGEFTATTASGDVRVARCAASATVRTASGDVALEHVQQGEVRVNSASGDVQVGVQRGTGVWLDLNTVSGSTSTDLTLADGEPQPAATQSQVTLRVRTASGDIRVRRTDLAPAA
jgi:hypothetical protein